MNNNFITRIHCNSIKFSAYIVAIISALVVLSCASTKSNNKILWVSGYKTEASGVGKMQVLNIHKGENLDNQKWENFYSPIEGFNFEEGYLKKIEVKEEKVENVPADASSIKYVLVKELEKTIDNRSLLNGDWILAKLNDAPINKSIVLPTLKINLEQKKVSGHSGCNNFSGSLENLNTNKLIFGNIISTKMACISNNIEQELYNALSKTDSFQVINNNLIFFSADGKKLLMFIKNSEKEVNKNLHDIWNAVSINGNPINRMSPIPRLEINLTEMKVYGNDGCNNYSGIIKTATDSKLIFGALASTKKMCANMDIADNFNQAMAKVASYKIDGLKLILLDNNNKEVLSFLKGD
ncbi:MAG: META domain-containing protein [Sphingobacteriales bacterium]|jgi:heat shock protein HslJ|nr:MAG: META domain-containing protein [Sphingobacteriales bacterium]